MRKHLKNLFTPHHGNNHKARLLHHSSLSKLVLLILFFQVCITSIARVKPGVLGFASNISVDQIIALTNSNRQASGLGNLTLNSTLSDSARRKAEDMFAKNYWAHDAPDGTKPWAFFKSAGYNYLYAGENLARDFGDSDGVMRAWMDSPTHRDNIMSGRYTEIGVAVVNGTLNGQETTLVVQHFGKPSAVAAAIPAQAASSVPQAQATGNPFPTQGPTPKVVPLIAVSQPEPVIEAVITTPTPQNNILFETSTAAESNVMSKFAISPLDATKSINIAMSVLVIGVLLLDGWLIYTRKTVRRSGKNFVHLTLFALVVIIIVLTKSGKIV